MINTLILLCTYQCFHRIHWHSTSIGIDYTIPSVKCWFGCHDWCQNTQNISCDSCKNRILLLLFFHQLKILKSIASFHWRVVSSIRILLWSTQLLDIGSDTDSVSSSNFRIRIRVRILKDVKKWYSYPG